MLKSYYKVTLNFKNVTGLFQVQFKALLLTFFKNKSLISFSLAPKKTKHSIKLSLLSSPHVHKKSFDQFSITNFNYTYTFVWVQDENSLLEFLKIIYNFNSNFNYTYTKLK